MKGEIEMNNELIDMLAEKLGAEYVGDLISKRYQFLGIHCSCGRMNILNPTKTTRVIKCPICNTYPQYASYKKENDGTYTYSDIHVDFTQYFENIE